MVRGSGLLQARISLENGSVCPAGCATLPVLCGREGGALLAETYVSRRYAKELEKQQLGLFGEWRGS